MTSHLPVEVESVGTLDIGPVRVPSEILGAARQAGLDVSPHRARWFRSVTLSQMDLIIGLAREHTAAVVVDGGAPVDKTFTLIELVRLLDEIPLPEPDEPLERARQMISLAHERRRSTTRFVPGEDLEDPFGGPAEGYTVMADHIRELSEKLTRGLFGTDARSN
jgi:protein-tyrosine phosphatase